MGIRIKNENTEELKLSIQVSLNGFSFSALSPQENKIVFFREVRFQKRLNPVQVLQQIEKVYEEERFLQQEKPQVVVLFSNELYTLVPQELFSEENASDYLKYNTKILETDFVAYDLLEVPKMVNVYIPFTNINNYFFEKYGEFEYRHCISILVEEFLKLNQDQEEGTKVYLNCYAGGYDLVVIQKRDLLLANSFKCNTKEDFIYYLLFTAEQLELDPTTFELILLGKITKNSDYYDIAYTYVKEVRFLKTSFGIIYGGDGEPPKGYSHYTLLKALQ